MRKSFADELSLIMLENKNVWLLTADLGYGVLDDIRYDFPDRFLNCGASEQAMVDIAVGLSLSGKIPFVYSITPFLLYRPFESIRNYVDRENLNIKMIGVGRNKDYLDDGFTHWAEEDREIMKIFKNIKCFYPETNSEMRNIVRLAVVDESPYYINLKRYGESKSV